MRSLRPITLIFLLLFAAIGGAVSLYAGAELRARAELEWLQRAEDDAARASEAIRHSLSESLSSLRSFSALFHGSDAVTKEAFDVAATATQGWDFDLPIGTMAYAVRAARSQRAQLERDLGGPFTVVKSSEAIAPERYESFVVSLVSEHGGQLALRNDLMTKDLMQTVVTTAYRTPDHVVVGRAFGFGDGHLHALIGFAAPNGAAEGVLVAILDLSDLFETVLATQAPKGLRLRFAERDNEARAHSVITPVIGPADPPSEARKTIPIRMSHGQARWELYWDVMPSYEGGPNYSDARSAEVGGSALTILIAAILGLLGWQNTRVSHLVGQRTTELENSKAELFESERRFRHFAEASSDWFWEMDENLCFSFFSERYSETTGTPTGKLLGKTRQEAGVYDVDPVALTQHFDDFSAQRSFRNFVFPRTKADGKVVWLSVSGTPIFGEDGEFRGYRGTGSDITELKEAQQQVELASKAKTEFLARMSLAYPVITHTHYM